MQQLYTEAGRSLSGVPWARYPRPQMVRQDWLCLNGDWDFAWGDVRTRIRVPFCPESLLSGVSAAPPPCGTEMHYARRFTLPPAWQGRRLLLHFGAVSRSAEVTVNGALAGRSENGYLPFTLDITALVRPGENELRVRCVNDLDPRYPWGKQTLRRGGMWYTPCSGIWQSVWLEQVPEGYIRALSVETGPDWFSVAAEGAPRGTVCFEGERFPLGSPIPVADGVLWTPETPRLYRFTVECGDDAVESYFALRTLSVGRVGGVPRLLLNGKPYFFHGLLDQGYWSDGLYTPAAPECYEQDILAMKALGFNTLRKHIKLEPEQFYYDCDRLGMLVFQDMVNAGRYSFLRDTGLPTLGITRLGDRRLNRDGAMRANFRAAMAETVRLLRPHPCIALWTIFNEGWGQFCADEAYDALRALDSTRFIDSTSGWFHQKKSDVDSLHIYFRKLRLGRQALPQLLSECGGYVLKLPEHCFNPDRTYGYRLCRDRADFVRELRSLYETQVLPLARKGLCGAIYTQVSDVEDETNGLLTFDRAVCKIAPEDFADLALRLRAAVEEA